MKLHPRLSMMLFVLLELSSTRRAFCQEDNSGGVAEKTDRTKTPPSSWNQGQDDDMDQPTNPSLSEQNSNQPEKTGLGVDDGGAPNDTQHDKIIDIHINTTTRGMPFPIPPGIIAMFIDSERVFQANFTLRCPDPHMRYVLDVTLQQLSHQRVARLSSPLSLEISCENGTRDEGGPEDYLAQTTVSGTFNISIASTLLGKGLLLFFLRPQSDEAMAAETSSAFSLDGSFKIHESASSVSSPRSSSSLSSESNASLLSSPKPSGLPSSPSSSPSPPSSRLVHQAPVLVLRPYRIVDLLFRICTYVIVLSATIAMGCKTDLKIVRETLKKPTAPVIGFFCQYVCMPLIAYGVARGMDLGNPLVSFGIFACGVCPGGGVSNMYAYMLGGDLSLSITLTTISTIASLGMIPFWLFTLGRTLNSGGMAVNIPFLKILETLGTIILPLFVGIFLQFRFPKVAKYVLKVTKPLFLVAVIFLLTVGIYANLYMFRLFEPKIILASCMLPYFGYIVGGLVSFVFRQPWPRVKTIALETGIQNVKVAILILIFSIPPPDGELAAVGAVSSAVMTGIPPLLVTLAYVVFNKVKGRPSPRQQDKALKKAMLEKALNKKVVVDGEKEKTEDRFGRDCEDTLQVKLTNSQNALDEV